MRRAARTSKGAFESKMPITKAIYSSEGLLNNDPILFLKYPQ
jgi:hypothetical protein